MELSKVSSWYHTTFPCQNVKTGIQTYPPDLVYCHGFMWYVNIPGCTFLWNEIDNFIVYTRICLCGKKMIIVTILQLLCHLIFITQSVHNLVFIYMYIVSMQLSRLNEFSLPQIVCSLGGSSKIGSHVYFLLMVLLLWRQIVLLWHQVTMVASEQHLYQTIILPTKLITGSIHVYLLCYCPLVGILFEVLRFRWNNF